MNQFVSDIIDDYLEGGYGQNRELRNFLKLSETSFAEWDNEEDAVYDTL